MITAVVLNGFVVTIAVLIHYEILFQLSQWIPRMSIRHRFRILCGVFGALIAHTIEIWFFGLAYYAMYQMEGMGSFSGNFSGTLLDCVYLSFTTFTTLGFGDIEPIGHVRFLTGLESLTGLVLITWTASFLYYEMQRYWDSQ